MEYGQVLANGLMLGAIYACIAVGFSLVWGVLNVINMLHGSFIILGGYITFFAWLHLKINPFAALVPVALVLFATGYLIQYALINRVVSRPVLTTLTLTFGLDMILYNFMNLWFTATPRRVVLDLSKVEQMDGSGIGAIAYLRKRLMAAGRSLDVAGVHGQPLALLRQLGLARSFGLTEERRPFWANLLRPLPGMGWGATRSAQA